MGVLLCACGCDLVIVDDYRSHCFLSLLRKHICSKSHSLRQHTPRLPLTRCIMSVLCPIDQMTAAVEPRRQLQKVHLSLLGPGTLRDSNSQIVAQLQSHTEAPAHYPCKERGEWTTHKALTERHAEGEKLIEMRGKRGREGCGNGEREEEDVGS